MDTETEEQTAEDVFKAILLRLQHSMKSYCFVCDLLHRSPTCFALHLSSFAAATASRLTRSSKASLRRTYSLPPGTNGLRVRSERFTELCGKQAVALQPGQLRLLHDLPGIQVVLQLFYLQAQSLRLSRPQHRPSLDHGVQSINDCFQLGLASSGNARVYAIPEALEPLKIVFGICLSWDTRSHGIESPVLVVLSEVAGNEVFDPLFGCGCDILASRVQEMNSLTLEI